MLRHGREMAAKMWSDFAGIANMVSSEDCTKIVSFCKATNKERGIAAFLSLAKSDERILVYTDAINSNPSLLNLQNGTFDMHSGEFRKHSQVDLITQIANVNYEPDAECPKWMEALRLIFDDDETLLRFNQQILGYSLAGDTGEHILPIAYGDGCNGKSFLWNAIIELAGDYGTIAHESLLMGDRNAHPTEKASLYQKRIVAISEPEQGSKMRESRVKELTGDSVITARRMREDFWTFTRTHTFWLSTNHLPRVSGTDNGIWRRIKLIPFAVDLRNKVKPIPDYHLRVIEDEGPGILNWLLAGYRDHKQHGFVEPAVVTDANAGYRGDQDHIGGFVADCCIESAECIVSGRDLYNSYQRWGGSWSQTAFGKAVSERYEKKTPTFGPYRNRVVYHGIGVVTDEF